MDMALAGDRLSIRTRMVNPLKLILVLSVILFLLGGRTASAFTGTTYNIMFYRTACGSLGNDIQGRFEPDIGTGSFKINEVGSQTGEATHNADGAFKFDVFAHIPSYTNSFGTFYPGIEAAANFLKSEVAYVYLTTLQLPVAGTSDPGNGQFTNQTHSYSMNFSSTSGEMYIRIHQNSTKIWATYAIISGGGSTVANWTLSQDYSSYTNPPPYTNENVNLAISGLENTGYAVIHSGTDFQMETVIHPDVSDYSGETSISWSGGNALESSPCASYYTDDEGGNATYTYVGYGAISASHEAYQYMTVG